jgi:hypothetical protein
MGRNGIVLSFSVRIVCLDGSRSACEPSLPWLFGAVSVDEGMTCSVESGD